MGKVMIHFTKDEIRYLAALVGLEVDEWENCGTGGKVEKLRSIRGRLMTCLVNEDCEVAIDE